VGPDGVDPGSLDLLRDIVSPPAPAWWPPATGWIILALLILAAGVVLLFLRIRRYRRDGYRRSALHELADISSRRAIGELPELLRRTALAAFSREPVVKLTGDAWLRFLDESTGTCEFTEGPGRRIVSLAYDPGAAAAMGAAETEQLFAATRTFITRHRRDGQ